MQTPGQCLEQSEQVFTTAHNSQPLLCAGQVLSAHSRELLGSSNIPAPQCHRQRCRRGPEGGSNTSYMSAGNPSEPGHRRGSSGSDLRMLPPLGSYCPALDGRCGAATGLVGKARVGQTNWNLEPAGQLWVCLLSCLRMGKFFAFTFQISHSPTFGQP